MAAKRRAGSQLTQDNWDDEDDDEPEVVEVLHSMQPLCSGAVGLSFIHVQVLGGMVLEKLLN